MCTVTYLPVNSKEFILTSNRDEAPLRNSEGLHQIVHDKQKLVFPKDRKTGGTWITASNQNRVVCLLNGAFIKHHHNPPCRLSRGKMVLKFFEYATVEKFILNFDFKNIEPFTLIVCENDNLYECKWDANELHKKKLDPSQAFIWSSSTLYTPEYQRKRELWFTSWGKRNKENYSSQIIDFHLNAGDGDSENSVVMNRSDTVKTVSITSIHKSPSSINLSFRNLEDNSVLNEHLDLIIH